jgi:hypothetical protein
MEQGVVVVRGAYQYSCQGSRQNGTGSGWSSGECTRVEGGSILARGVDRMEQGVGVVRGAYQNRKGSILVKGVDRMEQGVVVVRVA